MVNIKIFGGEREIGGNKILLEFKNTRLMLDFGLSFTQEKKILFRIFETKNVKWVFRLG